jgi:hypothetical protein
VENRYADRAGDAGFDAGIGRAPRIPRLPPERNGFGAASLRSAPGMTIFIQSATIGE